LPHPEFHIGEYIVKGVTSTTSGDAVKVKVKVRLDGNGCFVVHSAHMVEKLPTPPPSPSKEEPMETEQQSSDVQPANEHKESLSNDVGSKEQDDENKENNAIIDSASKRVETKPPETKKTKKNVKTTDLDIEVKKNGIQKSAINTLVEIENDLQMQIKVEKQLADAKNSVEEYVYDMRAKISEEYRDYLQESDWESFGNLLATTEDWLYEEGADEMKQVYIDKLAELKKVGDSISNRFTAHNELPLAYEAFGSLMTHYKKVVDLYAQKDEKYDHIEESEMSKVKKRLEEKFKWFNNGMNAFQKLKKYETPKILPSEIQSEKKALFSYCDPIINKAKPKVEPPKEESNLKDDNNGTEKMKENDGSNSEKNNGQEHGESELKRDNIEMEID